MSVSQQLYANVMFCLQCNVLFADSFVWPVFFSFSYHVLYWSWSNHREEHWRRTGTFFSFWFSGAVFLLQVCVCVSNMAALSLFQVCTKFVETCRSHRTFVLVLCLRITLSGHFSFTQLQGTLLILVHIIETNIDVGPARFFVLLQVCASVSKHVGLTATLCLFCVCG